MKLILDIGSCHAGDIKIAKEAIDIAGDNNAIIKFQLFEGHPNGNIELPRQWWPELVDYAKKQGVDIFASAFDENAIELLHANGSKKVKLAYSQNFNLKLIKKAKELGMEIWASGDEANYPNYAKIKLFCVPEYPVKNFRKFNDANNFDGLSVHLLWPFDILKVSIETDKYIEVHFHTSQKVDVPDYWFALSPKEVKELCAALSL